MKNDRVLPQYERWLRASSRADSTIKLRMMHARHLARRVTLTLAREMHVEEALAATRHLAPDTRHSILVSWRLFYRWALAKKLIMVDPTASIDGIRVPIRVPRVAPDTTVSAALRSADDRDRALVMLGRYACLRLTEITTLHMRHRQDDWLTVRGKGDKERIVFINDELMRALKTLERDQPHGYYFPGETNGHLHPQSVHKIIKRVTGWHPHSLRHAGATAAYRATGDLRAVQDMLGHASLATTQRYLHMDDDARRRVAAATMIRVPDKIAA